MIRIFLSSSFYVLNYFFYSNKESKQYTELKNQIDGVKNAQDSEELLDACKQFESYLWEQVYKAMQKSVDAMKDEEDKDGYANQMVDYFAGTTLQEIASRTTEEAEGANSLANTLYEQMKRNYGITD